MSSNRVRHLIQDFATDGDEFEVSGTGATFVFGENHSVASTTTVAQASTRHNPIEPSTRQTTTIETRHQDRFGGSPTNADTRHSNYRKHYSEVPPPKDHVSSTAGAVAFGLTALKLTKSLNAKTTPTFPHSRATDSHLNTKNFSTDGDDAPPPMEASIDESTFLDNKCYHPTLSRAVSFEDTRYEHPDLIEEPCVRSAPPPAPGSAPLVPYQDPHILAPFETAHSPMYRNSTGQSDRASIERVAAAAVTLLDAMATLGGGGMVDLSQCIDLASKHILSQEQRDHEDRKEMRKMMFDHFHQTADREQRQQHHEDAMTASREEKWWITKVGTGCDECCHSFYTTTLRSLVIHFGLKLGFRCWAYRKALQDQNWLDMVNSALDKWIYQCPQGQGSLSSSTTSFSLFGNLMPSLSSVLGLPTNVGCQLLRVMLVVLVMVLLYFIPNLSSILQLPQAKAGVVVAFLFIAYECFSTVDIILPTCFLGLWWLAYGYTCWAWTKSKSALKKTEGEYPTNREVNDALDEFENISFFYNCICWLASIVTFTFLAGRQVFGF